MDLLRRDWGAYGLSEGPVNLWPRKGVANGAVMRGNCGLAHIH
jgi:hypothetical protein